ncbi:acyl-CoA dehydrogenase family protein [Actinosynnema sp. NPDC020468]|uniref:acyl-CoA dehydrogenase family protein n=1 Tax=Actinosynnema sp. NPDC020468 TaxID=3154488 RepID=UPI0033FDCCD5
MVHELIRAHAATADRERRLPPEVVTALVDAGTHRLLAPPGVGGGLDLPTWAATIEDLARADGSTGWTAMTTGATSTLAWYLDEEAVAEVFGDPRAVIAGTAAPQGRLEDGRVTGRWGWGSAVEHCAWVVGGVLTPDGPRLAILPRAAVTVHDTWHAAGLRATGSHEWEADVAVPARRLVWPPSVSVDGPLPAFPFFAFLAVGVASVCLGVAARAVEEVEALATGKTPYGTGSTLAEQAGAQLDLATAEARLSAARAFLRAEVAQRWEAAVRGEPSTDHHRARLRLACSHAATESASVTRLAFDLGGGTSVFESSPLQRCLRDAHVAAQHAMVSRRLFESYAKVRLGVPTDTARL